MDDTQKVAAFNQELQDLLEKYELVLTAEAFLEGGLVRAKPTLVRLQDIPKKTIPEEHDD